MSTLDREQPHYFGAGPALLPKEVLKQAALDLVSYNGDDLGIGEMSHRSKPAVKVIDDTKANLVKLMNIPDTHEVFFMQGGGTTGFSSIAHNLMANYATKTKGKLGKAAYAVTGSWSKKSLEECKRLGFEGYDVVNTKDIKFSDIPDYKDWKPIKPHTAYLYVCDNETVNGVEFDSTPDEYLPEGVELVADMSSNILSKPVDVSKYGLIMAGAQKNIGIAGLTIYIIKKTLLEQASDEELKSWGVPLTPIAFHYPSVVSNNSTYNTIPIFTCHVIKLVTEKLIAEGGVESMTEINNKKAEILYQAIEKYPSVFKLQVNNRELRSNMNVVFTGTSSDIEAKFIEQATNKGLKGVKGHRSVGGMRASIYNAVSLESVVKLAEFIDEFGSSV